MPIPGYPKQMRHPSYQSATLGLKYQEGTPDRFPPVTVHSPDQEEKERSRGYLAPGETMKTQTLHVEYPKMMRHPEHVDATPPAIDARRDGDKVVTFSIPGVPEKFPDRIANTSAEEREWRGEGDLPRRPPPRPAGRPRPKPPPPPR